MINLEKLTPNTRYLAEMTEVLFDQAWAKTAPDLKLYYMYRDLAQNDKDRQRIKKTGLRYDITVMPFIMLGKEYNKTAGHDHPLVPDTNITYPEIYQVLAGQAIFLIQDSQGDQIKDVYAVKAKENDKVIILPNYEHLIINASGKELKTANWVCREFGSNIYKPFRQKRGFSYFAIERLEGEIEWIKNKTYIDVPELRFQEPNRWLDKFKIDKETELYSLVKDLKKLDFLKNPQKYNW
jgi:glucose-6-phosphate isomerase